MTLADFLLARVADDEDRALKATPGRWKIWGMLVMADTLGDSIVGHCADVAATYLRDDQGAPRTFDASHIAAWDPARVIAECGAKRQILDRLDVWNEPGVFEVVKLLALPYADHPDYQQEWA